MKPDIRIWLAIFGVLALVTVTVIAVTSIQAHAKAVAVAEQATGQRMEAARLAVEKALEARTERERTEEAIENTTQERARADALADSLEDVGAVLSVEAVETGESMGEAVDSLVAFCRGRPCRVPADTVQARVAVHLEADMKVADAFRAQISAMVDSKLAADSLIGWWQARSYRFEVALDASERECELCTVSERRWREAAQPSFFRGLWDDAPKLLFTATIFFFAGRGS